MDIIVDIDGTLADCTHRLHYITTPNRRKDWDVFFNLCYGDRPIMPVLSVAGRGADLCSGRRGRVLNDKRNNGTTRIR